MVRPGWFWGMVLVTLALACSSSSSKNDSGFGGVTYDAGVGGKGGAHGGTLGAGGLLGSGGLSGRGGSAGTTGVGAGGTLGTGGSTGRVDAAVDGPIVDAAVADRAAADVPLAGGDAAEDVGEAGSVPKCGPFADGGSPGLDAGATSPLMSFFVSSLTSVTGNLGGLAGADQRCQTLAAAVGLPSPLWHAYLSVEHDPPVTGASANARDRIGSGPWYNARGALIATDLASLHARTGDAALFLDEHGNMINGQWTGSPQPVEHDILTGSNSDGTLAVGKTCADWTSQAGPPDGGVPDGGGAMVARVGHADGFGPACSTSTSPINYTSWNSAHDNAGCDNTLPLGGAGRIYCFKANGP